MNHNITRRHQCPRSGCSGKTISWHTDPYDPDPNSGAHFWSCDSCGKVHNLSPPTNWSPPVQKHNKIPAWPCPDPFSYPDEDDMSVNQDGEFPDELVPNKDEPACICTGPQLIGVPNPECEFHKNYAW